MRFEHLHLVAFGPFTGQHLDLSGGAPGGLHLVYGPNEAGKSTSLRAVKNFLFGMPQRSPDAHVHPSAKLAILAEVSEGERRYVLTRRKRRRDDLVFSDGTVVTQNPLPELLGYLDERSFSSRFGLDQVELEKGAEALLGGSESGLFAAGTAGAEVRTVLEQLGQECEALFLPRGKVPLLNRRIAEYERAAREAKRAERPPEKWLEQEEAYQKASERATLLKAERQEVRSELRRLNRLKAVISDLGDFQRLETRLYELGQTPDLPEGAAEQRETASQSLSEASVEARSLEAEIQALELELGQLPAESSLTQVDESQLDLTARVGTALSARKDMPKRKAALLEIERDLLVLLRDLGRVPAAEHVLVEARSLLVGEEVTGTVRRLLTQRGALTTKVSEAERRLRELAVEQRQLDQKLGVLPERSSVERLEALIVEARAVGLAAAEVERLQDERGTTLFEIDRLRTTWATQAPYRELLLELPSLEAVRSALGRYAKVEAERDDRLRQRTRSLAELSELEGKLSAFGSIDLPSEEKLLQARALRDEQLVRALSDPTATERDSLRQTVRKADEMADRLRKEAGRVAQVLALESRRDQVQQDLARIQEGIERTERLLEKSHVEFAALVGRLGVGNPPPLVASSQLIVDMNALTELELRAEDLKARIDQRTARISQVRDALAVTLGEDSLLGLEGARCLAERRLAEAEKSLSRALLVEESRERLARAEEAANAHLDEARRQLQAWEAHWAEAVRPLGLGPDASAERASEVLSTLDRIQRQVDQATQFEGRILGMERDTEALTQDVFRVAAVHLPRLLGEDPVDAAVQLQEAIRGARRSSDERARVRRLLDERREKLSQVRLRIETAEEKLERLRRAACAESIADIARVEAEAREKREIGARLAELQQRIRVASEGTPQAELLEEARPWQGSVGRLTSQIDDLDVRNSELEQEYREAETEAEGMRLGLRTYSSEEAALSRQTASGLGAAAREALRAYLVRRTAHLLLGQQISRYAEKFRGPIAGHASQLFERVTLGKYSGLSIGVGDNTLRCLTEGREKELHELSRGTRAQLYFVLRMASLFAYFAEHPKVPLVFDDLFVDFDDDRTTAAFELLAEMAQITQVLYFTHLARDVEKAHDAVPSGRLFSHTIGV